MRTKKQKQEQLFCIVAKTNPWIAQRSGLFKGRTTVVLEHDLTLKQAQKWLLEYWCEKSQCYAPNWGVAVRMKQGVPQDIIANPTHEDGTRSFEDDSKNFSIEFQDEYAQYIKQY